MLEIVIISFISIIGIIVFCTVYDLCGQKSQSSVNAECIKQIIHQLALHKNVKALLNTEEEPKQFLVIHGIRVLATTCIMALHSYEVRKDYFEIKESPMHHLQTENVIIWDFLSVCVFHFGVDTFFMLTGFLSTYGFLQRFSRGQNINLIHFYLHRYIRLTPTILAVLCVTMFFVPHLGSSTRWKNMVSECISPCRGKWWSFLLYIQNYIQSESKCLDHLWYLAVDMQLHLISPLILYPLTKQNYTGVRNLSILILLSILVPVIIEATKARYKFHSNDIFSEMSNDIYSDACCRLGSWLIGVLFGYEIMTKNLKLNRVHFLGVSAGVITCCISIIIFWWCTENINNNNAIIGLLLVIISRITWAVGVGWIMYISIKKNRGLLASFLSLSVFIPLSRLTYSAYIIHILVSIINVTSDSNKWNFTSGDIFYGFLTDAVIAYIIALICYLFFERPPIILEKYIVRKFCKMSNAINNK